MGERASWRVASRWVRHRVALANGLADRGEAASAVRSLRRAERVAPRSGELKYTRALLTWVSAESNENVTEPKALVRKAAHLAREDPGLLVRCASTMVEMGGVDEIEPWVTRAEKLAGRGFPLADELTRLRGCVHWARGDLEAAEPLLRAAFYADPASRSGFALAATYMERGDYPSAAKIVEESLARGGRHPGLQQIRADLREAKQDPAPAPRNEG